MHLISEKQMTKPSLIVRGIKKRCRKIDFHIFNLKSREPSKVDIEELKVICLRGIKEKMKTVVSAHLSLQPETVSTYDDGSKSSTYLFGTDQKIPLEVAEL